MLVSKIHFYLRVAFDGERERGIGVGRKVIKGEGKRECIKKTIEIDSDPYCV